MDNVLLPMEGTFNILNKIFLLKKTVSYLHALALLVNAHARLSYYNDALFHAIRDVF